MSATTYRPLPQAPEPDPADDAGRYGLRLFAFLIASDGCTAVLSDEQLSLAEHAGARASGMPGLATRAYDRMSQVRHTIAATIAYRASLAPVEPVTLPPGSPADKPNLGPMAPLVDAPIVRPPSSEAIRLDPADRRKVSDSIAF